MTDEKHIFLVEFFDGNFTLYSSKTVQAILDYYKNDTKYTRDDITSITQVEIYDIYKLLDEQNKQ